MTSRLLIRTVLLSLLLITEVGLLSFYFDSPDLAGNGAWWATLVSSSSAIPYVMTPIAIATLLFGWNWLRDELRRTVENSSTRSKPWWPFLIGHLLALTVLVLLTNVVCSEGFQKYPDAGRWVAAWFASGLATVGLWAAAILPDWPRLLKRVSSICLMGAAVGLGACLLGNASMRIWDYNWARVPAMWAVSQCLSIVAQLFGLTYEQVLYQPGTFVMHLKALSGDIGRGLDVASLCSGYDAMGLLWMFLGVFFWRFRRDLSFGSAFLMFLGASAIMWSCVVLRLLLLMFVVQISIDAAVSASHSQLSWIVFNLLSAAIIVSINRLFPQRDKFPVSDAASMARS